MRQVILHAADKLGSAKEATIHCNTNHMTHNGPTYNLPKPALTSMSYAEGVLRLLASYLKVDPDQRTTATPEPGWTGQPQGNGHKPEREVPEEKVERNAAIVAAVEAGESKTAVAARFGISPTRVHQLVAARQRTQTGA
jgi:hypothetical protein